MRFGSKLRVIYVVCAFCTLAAMVAWIFLSSRADDARVGQVLQNDKPNTAFQATSGRNTSDIADALTGLPKPLWVHTWGGDRRDEANAVSIDEDGNVYVSGFTDSFGLGHSDVLLLKYSPEGDILWQKTWGSEHNNCAKALRMDADGDLCLAGQFCSRAHEPDVGLLKYSSSGELLWQKTWGGYGVNMVTAISIDEGGNLYLVGSTKSFSERRRVFFLKYSSDGVLLWQKIWGGDRSECANAVAVDGNGNAYLAGESLGKAFLIKYSSSGDLLWQKLLDADEAMQSLAHALCVDDNGDLYMAGYVYGIEIERLGHYAFLVKYSSDGKLIWQRTWGEGDWPSASATCMCIDSEGCVYVSGYNLKLPLDDADLLLLKYSSGGDLLWQGKWGSTEDESAWAIAVDNSGLLCIAGYSANTSGSWTIPSGQSSKLSFKEIETSISSSDVTRTEGTPVGTETSPEGVADKGGGKMDVLIMKLDPSTL